MSRTFSIPDQIEVESSVSREIVEDVDVFFLLHIFLIFFGVVGGMEDGSSDLGIFDLPFFFGLFAFPCFSLMNFFTKVMRLSSLGGVTSTSLIF